MLLLIKSCSLNPVIDLHLVNSLIERSFMGRLLENADICVHYTKGQYPGREIVLIKIIILLTNYESESVY